MNPRIEAKADEVFAQRKYVDKCISAMLCPDCGTRLAWEWTEERKRWFGRGTKTVKVRGIGDSMIGRAHCTTCVKTYTVF